MSPTIQCAGPCVRALFPDLGCRQRPQNSFKMASARLESATSGKISPFSLMTFLADKRRY